MATSSDPETADVEEYVAVDTLHLGLDGVVLAGQTVPTRYTGTRLATDRRGDVQGFEQHLVDVDPLLAAGAIRKA
jgi:hypothetical protein